MFSATTFSAANCRTPVPEADAAVYGHKLLVLLDYTDATGRCLTTSIFAIPTARSRAARGEVRFPFPFSFLFLSIPLPFPSPFPPGLPFALHHPSLASSL